MQAQRTTQVQNADVRDSQAPFVDLSELRACLNDIASTLASGPNPRSPEEEARFVNLQDMRDALDEIEANVARNEDPERLKALYRKAFQRYNIFGELIDPDAPMEHSRILTTNLLLPYDIAPGSLFPPLTRPQVGVDVNFFGDFVPCHADTDIVLAKAEGSCMAVDTASTEDPYMWDAPPPGGMDYGKWWGNSVDETRDGDYMGVDGEYFGSRH
ncbi:hypothetical protein NEOLEDRAFT_1181681 [Neolentinus lepideus HHB14362 ss-1]|uniref:Uncharacterized protein n=1 Tax=Neolentinus lepideus HHB14362 ss-1 TaxID=1314782 RepID=A0A165PUF7_9AGAM|nr:hypothetical protein NEOLEDRAFT_1181681 [Neolentinus lepideus HHB14362 ss-1]